MFPTFESNVIQIDPETMKPRPGLFWAHRRHKNHMGY